jgi:hypothetical protein
MLLRATVKRKETSSDTHSLERSAMGEKKPIQTPAGPRRSMRDWLSGAIVGFAAGAGLCAASLFFLTARSWDEHAALVAPRGPELPPAPNSVSAADLPSAIARAGEPAIPAAERDRKQGELNRGEAPPVAVAAPRDRAESGPTRSAQPALIAVEKAATGASIPRGVDQFALSPPASEIAAPFILPKKPWFALADVTIEEPASDSGAYCAANRSLNTAITWSKSPAEAAEQARREGKLVFLIHVSGNFEDPGFT